MESLPELEKPLFLSLHESESGKCKYDMRTGPDPVDSVSRKPYVLSASRSEADADHGSRSSPVD